jgi:hypothetical protein
MEEQQIQMWGETPLASLVRERTERIKLQWQGMLKRTVTDVWTLGTELCIQQEELSDYHHGAFLAWLKNEMEPLGLSKSTAYRMMDVARRFSLPTLGNLPFAVSALYLLASPSSPEEARREALLLAADDVPITRAKAQELIAHAQATAAPTTAPAYPCPTCAKDFPIAVWECPACHHHWPLDEPCDFCIPDETAPAVTPEEPEEPTPHEKALLQPGNRWAKFLTELYTLAGGIEEVGGMGALTARWPIAQRHAVAKELDRLVARMLTWIAILQEERPTL